MSLDSGSTIYRRRADAEGEESVMGPAKAGGGGVLISHVDLKNVKIACLCHLI